MAGEEKMEGLATSRWPRAHSSTTPLQREMEYDFRVKTGILRCLQVNKTLSLDQQPRVLQNICNYGFSSYSLKSHF